MRHCFERCLLTNVHRMKSWSSVTLLRKVAGIAVSLLISEAKTKKQPSLFADADRIPLWHITSGLNASFAV